MYNGILMFLFAFQPDSICDCADSIVCHKQDMNLTALMYNATVFPSHMCTYLKAM